jgi:hypothetical protein
MMRGLLGFVILILGLSSGSAAFAQNQSGLVVDASQDLGAISPYVYGVNYAQTVIPPDLMPTVQALGIKYLRLGGGPSDRADLDESTLDLFVLQTRQIGAEPAVTVRLLNGTPEKAAALVRYANIEKGYNIRYWSIGNEPGEFVPLHYASSYTTEDLDKNWRAIAQAMLAVDPKIILVGPDLDQYVVLNADPLNFEYLQPSDGGHPHDSEGRDWLQEFLRANGDLVGIVSIHRYPYPGVAHSAAASATIDGLRQTSREWDTSIPNLRKIIRNAARRDIPIAVTEVNSNSIPSSGGEAGLDSFYNAVWLADVLGRLIRQQVEIVAYWNLRSSGDGYGLLGIDKARPTYYVYMMYKLFGTRLVASSSDDPDVGIYAAKRDDGTLRLMVVNLASEEKTEPLNIKGFNPAGQAEVWRLDSQHNAEDIGAQALGESLTVPGQSVSLYVLARS